MIGAQHFKADAKRVVCLCNRPFMLPFLTLGCAHVQDGCSCGSTHLPKRSLLNAQCALAKLDRPVSLATIKTVYDRNQRLPRCFSNRAISNPVAARLEDAALHSAHCGVPSFSEGMGVGACMM